MCDAIHTPRQVDGLPILVELVQYPDAMNDGTCDRLATLLSEVASVPPRPADSSYARLIDLDALVTELRCCMYAGATSPAGDYPLRVIDTRAKAIQVAAAAVQLAERCNRALIEMRHRIARPIAPPLDAEVLRWLRQTIGEQKGLVGEHAIGSINPRAHVGRMLSAIDVDAVQTAITSRWGCEIVIGQSDTVAAVAEAIVRATGKGVA